jgi:hypothetical protein
MPASIANDDVKDFEVDPRIKIGLDALTPEDRRTVEEATRSKEDFLARISDPSQVFRLRPNAPYLALKITPTLRLIYTREADRIDVVDLRHQGMIDWFASMRSAQAKPPPGKRITSARSQRRGSREGAE